MLSCSTDIPLIKIEVHFECEGKLDFDNHFCLMGPHALFVFSFFFFNGHLSLVIQILERHLRNEFWLSQQDIPRDTAPPGHASERVPSCPRADETLPLKCVNLKTSSACHLSKMMMVRGFPAPFRYFPLLTERNL